MRDSRALRYLVPAVFPVYILHQTRHRGRAYNLKPLAMPPMVEGPLLVVLTFAACFGGYEVIRRVGMAAAVVRTEACRRCCRSRSPEPAVAVAGSALMPAPSALHGSQCSTISWMAPPPR